MSGDDVHGYGMNEPHDFDDATAEHLLSGDDGAADPDLADVLGDMRVAYASQQPAAGAALAALIGTTEPAPARTRRFQRMNTSIIAKIATATLSAVFATGGLAVAHALPAPMQDAVSHLGVGQTAHHSGVVGVVATDESTTTVDTTTTESPTTTTADTTTTVAADPTSTTIDPGNQGDNPGDTTTTVVDGNTTTTIDGGHRGHDGNGNDSDDDGSCDNGSAASSGAPSSSCDSGSNHDGSHDNGAHDSGNVNSGDNSNQDGNRSGASQSGDHSGGADNNGSSSDGGGSSRTGGGN